MMRARYSLPVPVSPCSRIGSRLGASFVTLRRSVSIAGTLPPSRLIAGGWRDARASGTLTVRCCGSMAWAKSSDPSRTAIRRSCGRLARVSEASSSSPAWKKSVTGCPIKSSGERQSSPQEVASSRAPPWVMPVMRPAPSTEIAASGSTSRNSGAPAKRSTRSCRLLAIRLASSMRRTVEDTRWRAMFWLVFRIGELRSEMSRTAASDPCVS